VSLIAFHKQTGQEVWRGGDFQISYASPQLATLSGVRQILSVNQDFISSHAVEDGKKLWDHPWRGSSNTNASASQALAVGDNRVYCSKGYAVGSELFEVTPAANGESWSTKTIWTSRTLKTKFSNAAFRDGYAYGLDDGVLACQDLETGQRQWKNGRYGFGQILLVGDTILVLDEDGGMHMVAATPEGHQELGSFQAIAGQTWNTLCLYGDLLLVRNGNEAACYRLPLRPAAAGGDVRL
jgi:outer membrane protein assembly factor BamB